LIKEIILNKNQNWGVFFVALILLINGVFIKALADDDDHKEKKWYKNIFDTQDNVNYIYSMLKPLVTIKCLIELAISPLGPELISHLHVTGVGS
jgi:hypothetical protein